MKKQVVSLALSVCMLLFSSGLPAFAATSSAGSANSGVHVMLVNTDSIHLNLSFSGDKSESTVIIRGKDGTSKIKADVYLMRVEGNTSTTVKHWSATSYGDELDFYKEYYVSSGYTYELMLNAAVTRNGNTEYINTSTKADCG
ncbi:hypothetical protein CAFE_17450 [Caprobacter fermentans]|uniref:Uncharacterized protein n=1 Tax=Caproicibacter fermentans TaxID=2576756 RepID=A0A6N8I0G0_9FIRM|nr:hypothetical protein [Caproicibacter fermentans]MVB11043.1 hypothetical protein [Caproicibacter fermentans]OCN01739.1 hypothetical protein A7X67_01220 [Clostridium sp. W14A]